jgi:hypothetical protein
MFRCIFVACSSYIFVHVCDMFEGFVDVTACKLQIAQCLENLVTY